MRATRRNVLVILGVLTIAGGALFGTGAFTQVEAQRSVDVNTQGDASAQLGLEITDNSLNGTSDGTIEFNEQDLNMNATTRYDGSFVITNNDGSTTLSSVTIEDPNGNPLVANGSNTVADDEVMYFEVSSGSAGSGPITYDVVFDTTNGDISQVDNSITIVAQS
jgi:hypothetical protein